MTVPAEEGSGESDVDVTVTVQILQGTGSRTARVKRRDVGRGKIAGNRLPIDRGRDDVPIHVLQIILVGDAVPAGDGGKDLKIDNLTRGGGDIRRGPIRFAKGNRQRHELPLLKRFPQHLPLSAGGGGCGSVLPGGKGVRMVHKFSSGNRSLLRISPEDSA